MTSYGLFTNANGDLELLRVPILFVASLPGSGLGPGILYYQASDNSYYYWNGSSYIGPLGAGGGGGGAPTTAQYVVMALDGTLSNERRLQAGAGLQLTDGGANGDATLLVPAAGITRAMLANASALSVIGRAANSVGVPADIAAAALSNHVLMESGGALVWGHVGTVSLANDAVTFAKMQNVPTGIVIGRGSAGTGDPEPLTVGGGLETTAAPGLQRSALTGDVTAPAGSNVTDIAAGVVGTPELADDAVTFAKFQNVNTNRLIGRDAAGSGDVTEIECGGLLEFNGFNAIRIQPNGTHGIMASNPTTGFAEWRTPANYPCYPLFRDASAQLIFPKISDGASFPGSPVDGQLFTHTAHGNTTYYYDSTRVGWLGPPQTIWFSAQADRASVAYMNWSPTTTAFQDTFGPIFGYPVRVTAMGVFMAASGTATLQVFDDGAGVTNASLALSAETSKKNMAMNSNTVAADSFLGVKVTSGTFEGPGVGFFEVRRFET